MTQTKEKKLIKIFMEMVIYVVIAFILPKSLFMIWIYLGITFMCYVMWVAHKKFIIEMIILIIIYVIYKIYFF